MMYSTKFFHVYLALLFILATTSVSSPAVWSNTAQVSSHPNKTKEATGPDMALAPFQYELLSLAFDAATSIPLQPHIKTRARQQQMLVETALELNQVSLALEHAKGIPNWRRRAALADIAAFLAQEGETEKAKALIEQATAPSEGDVEEWRKDAVSVKVARALTILGETQEAADASASLVDVHVGKLELAKAEFGEDETFAQQVETLDELLASQNFEIMKNALNAYTQLYDRYYADVEKREELEKKIPAAWDDMPIIVRLELVEKLAHFAFQNGDREKAFAFVDQAQGFVDNYNWPEEHQIQFAADVLKLRAEIGHFDRVRVDGAALLERFQANKGKIVNIYRAESIRPLAEAYALMGERDRALEVYKIVLAEGRVNPNSRPQAEDFTETAASIVKFGLEPDDELWKQLREMRHGLVAPW